MSEVCREFGISLTPTSFAGSDQLTTLRGSILHADKGSIFNAV
jgi:hypothetical protein